MLSNSESRCATLSTAVPMRLSDSGVRRIQYSLRWRANRGLALKSVHEVNRTTFVGEGNHSSLCARDGC
eukprot:417072-Alexandrium_andersonii.AAC.1